ncbi:hypothetical protein G9C98_008574 [Cotesia typhae]|uniref:Phosphoglycerate mutase n=1 Tax=Cotesia typhae TaxID=2053667 RepID=A0A8J5QJ76_9HYME|nr:hypothetical protein G9C98_008574 [Cotesia typhae]
MAKYRIVMVRHGESEWNQLNLFCGWFDAGLSEKGKNEAIAAGKALKDSGYRFDEAHTSVLTRAQVTLGTILKEIDQENIPIFKTWRLNERHYGGLTGMNKAETAAKYGEEQVQIWRRSFDTPPPPMEADHKYYDTIVKDERYKDELSNDQIMSLNLPTGIPFVYELDENFKPVVSMKFLGDEETVKAAMAAVAAQGKAK